MVYVKREKVADNRSQLLRAAGRLFRERGIDGVGVAEIARAADLTHGALYAHFSSKGALAAEAFTQGLERSREAFQQEARGFAPSVASFLTYLLAPWRRDNPGLSCPMTASASEIGRQDAEFSARYVEGFLDKAAAFEAVIDPVVPADERRRMAITIVAAEIGAMAAARAVAKSDPAMSDEILAAVRQVMVKVAAPK